MHKSKSCWPGGNSPAKIPNHISSAVPEAGAPINFGIRLSEVVTNELQISLASAEFGVPFNGTL